MHVKPSSFVPEIILPYLVRSLYLRNLILTMGDAVVSAFLRVLFQTIADFVKEELHSEHRLEQEREGLTYHVDRIQTVLRQAEKKTHLSERQESLFSMLKDTSYQGAEVLDEYFYEVQRRQVIPFAERRNSTIFTGLNPFRIKFRHDMEKKIKEFAKRMDQIEGIEEMYRAFQADEGGRLDSTTFLPPTVVRGRDDDQERIVDMLLQPDGKHNVAVLSIVGEAYIGKTTVAQLVFNNNRISMHFDLKLWVHVSHEFNIKKIISSIIESIQLCPFHTNNLTTLQTRMEEVLRGKKYLLVLDDYWSEDWHDWDNLKSLLYRVSSGGSKIIVTTRSETVARALGTLAHYKLKRLQEKDCWLLFCQCAQGTESHAHNYRDNLDRRLKEEVLQKCNGVPFIAASLGHSMFWHQENDRSKWADILQKEWDSSTNHFNRARRLSYAQLDSHLKPCFAYSSIIPQKFQFEKEWLIQHWMAQGFIQPNCTTSETIEDTGRSYFRSLVSQSFFQRAHVDCTGEEHSYSIPEMMHDLASQVSGADCKCYMMGKPYDLPETVRHLTVVFNKIASEDMFQVISCGKNLHTFIVLGGSEELELKIPNDIGKRFTRLRTLDLSHFGVTDLPKSIGKLIHLRCLQLQGTKIKCLPESICNLYNLETLGLRNCYDLEELPHDLKNLRKLRHIDLAMTRDPLHICSLRYMPKGIGLLKNLQTMSIFVVSKRISSVHTHIGGIDELAGLKSLRGKLLISNLHLVEDGQEAAKAQLYSKQFLQNLELSWSDNNVNEEIPTFIKGLTSKSKRIFRKFDSSCSNNGRSEKVLEHLKAPTGITVLTISGYLGMACPRWLGSAEYMNLVTVCLYNFQGCSALPPLGLLPALENLHLKGWDRLISMNCSEFCSFKGNEIHEARFKSLKKLHLERMDRLKHWDGDERCCLPSLVELVLENCLQLEQVAHCLPSLTKVTVEGSPDFRGLRNFPSLKHVKANASGEWIWGSWPSLGSPISISLCKLPTVHFPSGLEGLPSLQRLEISYCEQLVFIPDDWPPRNLSHFSVRHCPKLRELPSGIQRLKGLEDMEIVACGQLARFPEMTGLVSLIRLEIAECASIQSLPNTGLPSSLQFLSINKCHRLATSCKKTGSEDHVKIKNVFSVWIDECEVSTSAGC
ncbi:unnamed protein product [Urochloa decumbens]|uniref:Uncharacterized protein n=1 Tax=Urochloa decumbens TaxID=240449 RepID=A0ABC8YHU2_9POAL